MRKLEISVLAAIILFGGMCFYSYRQGVGNVVFAGSNGNATPPQVTIFNVSGNAWSENIGWISFKNPNAGSSYGVNIHPLSGILSGYAWSEHIGWIDFNQAAGCPKGTCQGKLNLSWRQQE
ncbi:MAG: hypothetical protein HZA36_02410 [Parcubacteria group bacterium]|nr:hypothetical protein [Parcubacteria group bacterium]